ncbi:hypothetical protein Q3G72_000924 [Acer saccharum]|nr:hypothetical protein Q3G72_000924 [Acer saccharum]
MACLCQSVEACCHPQIAEALAIRRGLHFALEAGLVPAMLESDALSVVKMIGSNSVPNADIGVIIHDVFEFLGILCFESINFVPRLANKVAHSLAKLALSHRGEFVWLKDCPLSVEGLVRVDCLSLL